MRSWARVGARMGSRTEAELFDGVEKTYRFEKRGGNRVPPERFDAACSHSNSASHSQSRYSHLQKRVNQVSILLIDDDAELSALMAEYFSAHQIPLTLAQDGEQGLARVLDGNYDLVLLDVMMPRMDGFETLRQIRRKSTVPVIMLTARTEHSDRITGLNAGADDYLAKPFSPDELLARVQAVLRRSGRTPVLKSDVLEANGVRLNPGTRQVLRDGHEVEVTSLEYDILEILVRSAGRVVSRDDLARSLYNRQADPLDRALDVHVSHLRKKLEKGRTLIRTVRGVGYLFAS